ncbi:MAG TPA: ParB/RepB/Spo0J family partition protein [Bacteroidales bacterium]|nr:MAG: putative chromosome-partitioning protein ParB [Bacteroidetes bacterium ADurb.Bin217]HOS84963.1 ParB/RepB/Spo0J family partition protein [Bacteroidales bacterium]HPH15972.1 ParB/RepB/Spo0J family partition protein [Bacteroidales bacterium]HPM12815.1 ParB/RepB/Spo0J family partition protein [Bacteroidales bacterium]
MTKKNALGKGIGALLGDTENIGKPVHRPPLKTGIELEISKIQANPNQPRTKFDEEALAELAESITYLGVIQPITVREVTPETYQIISGERRFRAAQLAGLDSIPAYIRTVNEVDMLTMALVENVQREDLDAIEIATSYQRLIEECSLTQEKLSERVGKKRATIANYLRLLKLPPEIQLGIINEDISMGHARALITIEDSDLQVQLFTKIIESELSVREVEEMIRKYKEVKQIDDITSSKQKLSEQYKQLQDDLCNRFKSKVTFSITPKGSGKITLPFTSEADLERILGILDKIKD